MPGLVMVDDTDDTVPVTMESANAGQLLLMLPANVCRAVCVLAGNALAVLMVAIKFANNGNDV